VTGTFPIAPPPELVQQWEEQFLERPTINGCYIQSYIAAKAAQWGADMELEACCEWLEDTDCDDPQDVVNHLRITRRPKPPSLKEQALAALNEIQDHMLGPTNQEKLIRRALEALDD
jgi:hypothetical protein